MTDIVCGPGRDLYSYTDQVSSRLPIMNVHEITWEPATRPATGDRLPVNGQAIKQRPLKGAYSASTSSFSPPKWAARIQRAPLGSPVLQRRAVVGQRGGRRYTNSFLTFIIAGRPDWMDRAVHHRRAPSNRALTSATDPRQGPGSSCFSVVTAPAQLQASAALCARRIAR